MNRVKWRREIKPGSPLRASESGSRADPVEAITPGISKQIFPFANNNRTETTSQRSLRGRDREQE